MSNIEGATYELRPQIKPLLNNSWRFAFWRYTLRRIKRAEVHWVEHEWRITASLAISCNQLTRKREQKARALGQQQWFNGISRDIGEAKEARIDQFNDKRS
jgi:hypothetical protein